MPLQAIKSDTEEPLAHPADSPLTLHPLKLGASAERVVIRPFYLGWQATEKVSPRAARLVEDVMALPEDVVRREYQAILSDFSERHWQTESVFDERFAEISTTIDFPGDISLERRRLVGAYFCHEYSYAAAALMNPSTVPHPDQSGLSRGAVRFAMSLRAVGEGHISSIAFREGIVESDGNFVMWPQPNVATAAMLDKDQHDPNGSVCIHRHPESTLSGMVIFPMTDAQRNGLEDLRLVRFEHGPDDYEWIGTYTAYDGKDIRSELLRTRDFRSCSLGPIEGVAARNKGMALFPKKLNDRYYMLGRQDGKNLYLLSSDRLDRWNDDGILLMEPKYPWEFIQIGNCGSPILCDEGWLVLTHGVGAMRKYSLGAALLDRDDPSRVIARSPTPLLSAKDSDREGYVPNVVYTCGAMCVGDVIFMPYGISDSAIGFATIPISDLIASLEKE